MSEQLSIQRMVRFADTGNVRAICDLNFNDALLIRGLRVVDGQKGRFVSMPRTKGKQGWFDLVSPIDKALKESIATAVLEAYAQPDPEENMASV